MTAPCWRATLILLAALAAAALAASGNHATALASRAAWIAGFGLAAAFVWEVRQRDPRLWFRLDWGLLAAAYYLTLAEFLAPQPQFATEVAPGPAAQAIRLVLLGIGGIALGRHLLWRDRPLSLVPGTISLSEWIVLLTTAFLLGHLNMALSVHFNPVRLVQELLGPRFSQPWSRERLGDARAFLSELQLLTYLVPPLTAVLLTRPELSPWRRAALSLPLIFILFATFCSGTRYVLATHLATFASALAWSLPRLSLRRALCLFAAPALLVVFVTVAALHFRHQGLAASPSRRPHHRPPNRFIVDNNVRTIAKLTGTFPEKHPYLGLEIPWHILVRPIPRALYPGKPEKLSLSMEEIIGIPQTTIAASFAGEGYLMAGGLGSLLFGLALGTLAGGWNRIPALGNPPATVLYALGFSWAFLGARSPIWISIGFLPSIALIVALRIAFPVARRLLPAQGEPDHGPPCL